MTAAFLTNSLDEEILEQNKIIKEAKKNLEKIWYENIENVLRTTRAKVVSIVGYTPGFNDGDPCTHCENTAIFIVPLDTDGVNFSSLEDQDYCDIFVDDPEFQHLVEMDNYDALAERIYGKDGEFSKFWKVDSGSDQGFMQKKYETNFNVLFYLDSEGKLVEKHEDYWCGY
jgi:hypothetical protein